MAVSQNLVDQVVAARQLPVGKSALALMMIEVEAGPQAYAAAIWRADLVSADPTVPRMEREEYPCAGAGIIEKWRY